MVPKLAMTPGGRTDEGAVHAVVIAVTRTQRGTMLVAKGPSGEHVVTLGSRPDGDAARRRLAAVRRIDGVEFRMSPDEVRAVIRGSRHRLPFTTPIPVTVALGLTELGVRATIVNGAV